MSRFLKLTNIILNINEIQQIIIETNRYTIYMVSRKITGGGVMILGSGGIDFKHESDSFVVNENTNPVNYKKVSDWINEN